jgi:trans-aconitate methyltransferase
MPFEFDGRKYRRASSHQKEWGARLIEELDLSGAENVLDVGCGDGALSARIAGLVPRGRVLGIDASRGMIEAARGRAAPNLDFRVMPVAGVDFEDEFDVCFSNAALHWVLDHRDLLVRVHRALRERGLCRFNFAGDGNCRNLYAVVRGAMAREPYGPHFAAFRWPWFMPRAREYEDLLEDSPFAHFDVWEENADRHFPDAESMTRWIDQPCIVPFLAALPEDLKRPFRDEVVAEMIAATQEEDGRCFETFRRLNVLARK